MRALIPTVGVEPLSHHHHRDRPPRRDPGTDGKVMLVLILLAQLAATPTPTSTPSSAQPTPTPVKVAPGHPRTLADVARERKLGVKGKGSFSAAQSTVVPSNASMTEQERQIRDYGEPEKRNVTTFEVNGKVHTSEQWIYDFGYIYFRDGHLEAVQGR